MKLIQDQHNKIPQFSPIPPDYDETYLEMSRRGARVLALGWRDLGRMTPQQVRELTREELETDLKFVGFVVISCPLKNDSKSVIKEILHASHSVSFNFFSYFIKKNVP